MKRAFLALTLIACFVRSAPAANTVTLSISNSPVVTSVGASFDIVISVQAGLQPVDSAAAYVNFDPAILQCQTTTDGTSLPINLQDNIDNTLGHIDYAAGTFGAPVTGTFTLVTVHCTASAPS